MPPRRGGRERSMLWIDRRPFLPAKRKGNRGDLCGMHRICGHLRRGQFRGCRY